MPPNTLRTPHQVGRHISILFDSTLEDPSLLMIPQQLLANEAASCTFADVLLSFLVHQMDDLAGYEERSGSCMIWMRSRWGDLFSWLYMIYLKLLLSTFGLGGGGGGARL